MVLHMVAVNIRSTYNVGALFRIADSLGVTKIWLTGYTASPEHPSVTKTALGAEKTVPWEHIVDPIVCMERLHQEGVRIVGLELTDRAMSLADYCPVESMALVLGNEVDGLSALQLEQCDDVVFIPQKGQKESLNVMVATGIAVWELFQKCQK